MPFRWVITHLERKRTAASVSGVLRNTRQILAPDYQPLRLRIAPQPITLPPDATQQVGS
jgi:hypothetical protein